MKQKLIIVSLSFLALLGIASCKKYLETKSIQTLATPSTLDDLEAILNYPNLANRGTNLLNGLTDEYYYSYSDWQSRVELHKNAYIWEPELNNYDDWSIQYKAVFYANTVLFNLELISKNEEIDRRKRIKGAALFYRALAFYRIALLFSTQYDSLSASLDLGIPLRLKADINDLSTRSSVQQTYNQIIADLNQAIELLPNGIPNSTITKTQPQKAAAYALLARIYLQIGDYENAKINADLCLKIHNVLIDFNDPIWVNPSSASPFKILNPEVILYSNTDNTPNISTAAKIDSNLYRLYDANDLRKLAYFSSNTDGSNRFKGSYNSSTIDLFCGIATDEIFLIKAECYAREGNWVMAMSCLNELLKTRWRKVSGVSTYINLTAIDANDALKKVLLERRKELVYREMRWADLKRFNRQQYFATTISRNLNGQTIQLLPNDLRYTLLIPMEVMRIASLEQNPR